MVKDQNGVLRELVRAGKFGRLRKLSKTGKPLSTEILQQISKYT
jgi:hypothetical protein